MNVRSCTPVDAGHRARVLRALGLVPWTRRTRPQLERADGVTGMQGLQSAPAPGVACVIVLAEHCSPAALDLLGRVMRTGGPLLARAGRIQAHAGKLDRVPAAATYLVFGAAQAEILRQSLPAALAASASLVVVDELAAVLAEGRAKQRLWVALRGLRARLAAPGA
jgi:hypothetical protein